MQDVVHHSHQPVLLSEVIEALDIDPAGNYLDCTFGRGGHSKEILSNLGDKGKLLALDQDPHAIAYGKKKFAEDQRIKFKHCNFSQISQVVKKYSLEGKVNGILFDLGVSSPQLDDPDRGFSFMQDGPLDMRMNINEGMSAADWLQIVSTDELQNVLKLYGQERYAKKIATAIVRQREVAPFKTTGQLAEVVQKVIGHSREHKHPATRTFQAIRIFINKELEVLESALDDCVALLAQTGRLLVITFHSLEDQLVKSFYRKHSQSKLPRKLPMVDQFKPELKRIYKPITPAENEIANNPRSRSAKLHVMERLGC